MSRRMITIRLTRQQAIVAASWLDSALNGADPSPRTRRIREVVRKIDRALEAAPHAGDTAGKGERRQSAPVGAPGKE
jgi:hypothetical protein